MMMDDLIRSFGGGISTAWPILVGFALIASVRPVRALGRLVNARIATGHWPSQDPEARRIYLGVQ
jgi:hypothetical protein